jgi:hypothetical protein
VAAKDSETAVLRIIELVKNRTPRRFGLADDKGLFRSSSASSSSSMKLRMRVRTQPPTD